MSISRLAAAVICAIALTASSAQAQTYLVDTGPGGTSSIGAPTAFAAGSTTCSPQPACAAHFQYLAAQFTLTQAVNIDAIELWTVSSTGGSIDVKIREDVNGLPSTNAPPLFSANSVYSKRYGSVPAFFNSARWLAFQQYEAVLPPGTYWVTFEPVSGSNLNMSTSGNAAQPAPKYAFYADGNNRWIALDSTNNANYRLGVRIHGTTFPGLAFGTATRTFLQGNTFGYAYDYDFIRSGTRDFTPVGVQGPALTSSWLMVIPGGYVNGHSSITERGPSAGGYAVTDGDCLPGYCNASSNGAARAIAYLTMTNMSNVTETRQLNAVLEGSFLRRGKHAYAGVHVFKADAFSATILNSGLTPQEFLLRRDGLAALADGTHLSLTNLFAADALLATVSRFVDGPYDNTVQQIPLPTGLITLDPQESVTVLFDLVVYAPPGGGVNFGDTLKPAPNFVTDAFGNPAFNLVIVSPIASPSKPAASITVSPATSSTPLGTPASVTATVRAGDGSPVANANVTFSIGAGPNANLTQQVPTDSNGEAILTYVGSALGTDSIAAAVGSLQATAVTNTWTVGPLDHITIAPAAATIPAGGSQPYTAEAFDLFGNSRGDITGSATFSITPDGSCAGATCGAAVSGPHTVTGQYGGKAATATLTVTAATSGFTFSGFFAPVDNAPVLNTAKAGSAIPVKFSLNGNQGLNIFAAGYPLAQQMACDPGAPLDAITETLTAGQSSLSYDPATDKYTYVWKTDKGWANTCRQLTMRLTDGSSHTANFRFSK
jgi:hypothetical protein